MIALHLRRRVGIINGELVMRVPSDGVRKDYMSRLREGAVGVLSATLEDGRNSLPASYAVAARNGVRGQAFKLPVGWRSRVHYYYILDDTTQCLSHCSMQGTTFVITHLFLLALRRCYARRWCRSAKDTAKYCQPGTQSLPLMKLHSVTSVVTMKKSTKNQDRG